MEAYRSLKAVLDHDPEAMLTSPPIQCETAGEMLERDVQIADIPSLIRKCIEVTEKHEGTGTESDLHAKGKQNQDRSRDMWYLYAYLPLVDAHIRLQEKASAEDILSQVETKLKRMRPPAEAASEEKYRFAEMEARWWHMKGKLAELTGRKMDALVLYRNALTSFPVRRPRADSRQTVMAMRSEFGRRSAARSKAGTTGPQRVHWIGSTRVRATATSGQGLRPRVPSSRSRIRQAVNGKRQIWPAASRS